MATNALQERFGTRFRRIITNTKDGVPPWMEAVESGETRGLYLPHDAPWVVHGDVATLIGGIRALLMQALHPGSLTGVEQHSRYEHDPLGRLAGTTRWLTIATFGSAEALEVESARVNRMHDHVKGQYVTGAGVTKDYKAADPDLLAWVHIAFTDSFLTTHELFGEEKIPGGADEYVSQWSKSVVPLGLTNAPMSRAELKAEIKRYKDEGILSTNETTKQVVEFIRKPPLSRTALIAYDRMFDGAVASMPADLQAMLGLKGKNLNIAGPITRGLLRAMRLALGPISPLEVAAISRLKRTGALPPDFTSPKI
ncbi:MAG: oxygenase MpaB family protein [Actinomycetes bacterium]